MTIYWVEIDVQFKYPMELLNNTEGDHAISGYLQNIGATYPDEDEMKQAIQDFILTDDGMSIDNINVVYEYIGIISPSKVQTEIYEDLDIAESLRANPENKGIWYSTGRGFYFVEE